AGGVVCARRGPHPPGPPHQDSRPPISSSTARSVTSWSLVAGWWLGMDCAQAPALLSGAPHVSSTCWLRHPGSRPPLPDTSRWTAIGVQQTDSWITLCSGLGRPQRRVFQRRDADGPTNPLPDGSLDYLSAFLRRLPLKFESIEPTRVVGSMGLGRDQHTPWGVVHGGAYTTAIESAASLGASMAVLDRDQFAVG